MKLYIDQSVYPEYDEPPSELPTIEDKADYVHRICTAWDFGIHPEPQTFKLFSQWKEVFDRFPVLTSPGYHSFRTWFNWEPKEFPAHLVGPLPRYVHLDRLEGRGEDPCVNLV